MVGSGAIEATELQQSIYLSVIPLVLLLKPENRASGIIIFKLPG